MMLIYSLMILPIKLAIMIMIITIMIVITIINIYIAQKPCEYYQMRVTNKYDTN